MPQTNLLAIQDLNATINHEPRVLDLRLAQALDYDDPHKIRPLVLRNIGELETHGQVSATVAETSSRGGRPGKEYWLNEPQALLICMFSRTPMAAAVRKAVIEVFMAYRRAKLLHPVINQPGRPTAAKPHKEPRNTFLTPQAREEIRRLYATGQWRQSDLAAKFGCCLSVISMTVSREPSNLPAVIGPDHNARWRAGLEVESEVIAVEAAIAELTSRFEALQRTFYAETFGDHLI